MALLTDHDKRVDQLHLGLFPLRTVLLPGGALGLRIFETRYLDLVRDCSRDEVGFGICLVLDDPALDEPTLEESAGDDTSTDASDGIATDESPAATPTSMTTTTAAFGTEAWIEDFGSGDDGLLTIRVRGRRRFRVLRTRVRDNGLILAQVDWREPDPDDELRPEHAILGMLVRRLLEQAGGEHADAHDRCFDDAAWIGWRLAELLPLADRQRQALLQEDDPHIRLDSLLALMPD